MAKKNLKDATLQIRDGTGTPLTITVKLGSGNITWTENYGYEYDTERGVIADGSVRSADEQAVEVNVTARWDNIIFDTHDPAVPSGDASVTPYEALMRVGAAAAWVTTGADECEPYACELYLAFSVSDCAAASSIVGETVTFGEFRCETCAFDPQAGTLVFSGKSKEIRPAYARA